MANPFSGVKLRGAEKGRILEISRAFTDADWTLVRAIAHLERRHARADRA